MRLEELVPPPALAAAGDRPSWEVVREQLGAGLPADYRRLVEVYGAGEFGGFFQLLQPGAASPYLDLVLAQPLLRESLEVQEIAGPIDATGNYQFRAVLPPWAQGRSLLACGVTTVGGLLFWVTDDAEPDAWPVVLVDRDSYEHVVHRGGLEALLVDALTGRLEWRFLPGDLPQHRTFVPF